MIVDRRFCPGFAGGVGYALNRMGGERGWRWVLRKVLRAVEQGSPAS